MFRATLMMLLVFVSSGGTAQIAAPSVAPSYWRPWNEVRAYAPDLIWKMDAIPKAIFNALPKNMTEKDEDGHPVSIPGPFASIDLDGKGKPEMIVKSGEAFSGGPAFAILQQRENRWRVIGEIQGGFTVSKRSTNGFADIETWSRHPETYHHLWKFSNGRYKIARREVGPWEDRAFDPPYIPGIRVALTSQANEFKKSNRCPGTGQLKGSCPGYAIVYVTPLERGGADSAKNMQWSKVH